MMINVIRISLAAGVAVFVLIGQGLCRPQSEGPPKPLSVLVLIAPEVGK